MKKLKVRKQTIATLAVVKGGEDFELPPTAVCDPLKAERVGQVRQAKELAAYLRDVAIGPACGGHSQYVEQLPLAPGEYQVRAPGADGKGRKVAEQEASEPGRTRKPGAGPP